MNIDPNIAQILISACVSIIIGAVSAWMAGKFAVTRALEQIRKQRGFDRRLEWYEKTAKTINQFLSLEYELDAAVFLPSLDVDKSRLITRLRQTAEELYTCLRESILFAEPTTVRQLQKDIDSLALAIAEMDAVSGELLPAERLVSFGEAVSEATKVLMGTVFVLAASVRKQLGLDPITMDDTIIKMPATMTSTAPANHSRPGKT